MLDFETEAHKGVMLVAGQNTHAPEIAYPLRKKGWHAIHFGLRSYGSGEDETRLQVRLTGEKAFAMIKHKATDRNRFDDYYWKSADLTGQQIVMRQFWRQIVPDQPDSIANPCNGAWLAYIKLVPLSDEEVKVLLEERRTGKHRRLFAHHDAWSYTYEFRPTTVAEIHRELEPFRDTDFSRLYWEGGAGDRMYFPTRRGLRATDDWIEDPYRVGDRLAAEAWREFRKKGIDPYRAAIDHTHSLGMEFHGTYRPAGFHFPVPEDEWNTNGVYDRHPQWRSIDKNGQPTPRLSYALPEVRNVALDFIREMASYPVDGICLAYNRRPPLIEYEPVVVESFQKKHGLDPRQLDERDSRWLAHRAEFLTQFMREVRALLKKVAAERKLSKPLDVTAVVMTSERENIYRAIDLEAWIKEGLVDTIVPYSTVEGLNSALDSFTNPQDAEFFLRIARGTSCKVALNLMPRVLPPEEYRKRAHGLYQSGADHLFLWDTNARYDFSPSWSALRRLGHKEEIAEWVRSGSPAIERPGSTLTKLGDWDLRYATPG
ncbi:MAG: family 10 glycosylhydrolase [Bryobacteraceae bacterium]